MDRTPEEGRLVVLLASGAYDRWGVPIPATTAGLSKKLRTAKSALATVGRGRSDLVPEVAGDIDAAFGILPELVAHGTD